jgi:cell shape-determining protein MreD
MHIIFWIVALWVIVGFVIAVVFGLITDKGTKSGSENNCF